jgi:thioesterase domain-containing protein
MTGNSNTFTNEARAALWNRMLALARHLREQQPLSSSLPCPIVQLRQGRGGLPVYWIDAGLDEFKLIQLLATDNPVYAVDIRWPSVWHRLATMNETRGLPTVAQIVAPYVAAVKAHTSTSRCVLGAHSFGGVMAFEATRQLALLDIHVEVILLCDAAAVYPRSREVAWQKLKEIWSLVATNNTAKSTAGRLTSSFWVMRWMLGLKWRGLCRLIISAIKRSPKRLIIRLDDTGRPITWPRIQYVYDNAMKTYRMSPLDCRAVLFRAESRQDAGSRSLEIHLGWDGLFRNGLEVVSVPGGHISMLRQPHARVLAREMSLILSRAQ